MKLSAYWTISHWVDAYSNGAQPAELLSEWLQLQREDDPAWIEIITADQLAEELSKLDALKAKANTTEELPLYGIPIAVKDNIDALGFKTTAACPKYSYSPSEDAFSVKLLRDAGAIIVGKSNLDQFATGLVGTRSPYGEVPNSFDPKYISGGSSSGSASLVARGLVPVALGTDTAGSGRVPAGFNNIIGLKGTRGAISTQGVVPACRTLDCVSVFALTLSDASLVFKILRKFNVNDPWCRSAPLGMTYNPIKKLGIPRNLPWFGDARHEQAWHTFLSDLSELDVELVKVDFTPFWSLASLLYEGPWVAERYVALNGFCDSHACDMNPVVRQIIEKSKQFSAASAFQAEYERKQLQLEIGRLIEGLDGLLVPTTPFFPTIHDVSTDPITTNTRLGTYTNFVNLSDMCALSFPAGLRSDGLPFGATLIAPAWHDLALQETASQWLSSRTQLLGNSKIEWPDNACIADAGYEQTYIDLAVVGAHLSGMPLNWQLVERGAKLIEKSRTREDYRLYALANTTPPKPGLARTKNGGGSRIEVEVWRMPTIHFGSFMSLIPAPLGIGTVLLESGRSVKGFICEEAGLEGAVDITSYGGWRNYCSTK